MVKYVSAIRNIGFYFFFMRKNIINLRIVYNEHSWTLYIEPNTREISISIRICMANTYHK